MNLNETYSNTKGRNARRKTFTLATPVHPHGGATNQTFVGMRNGELSQVGRNPTFSGNLRQSTRPSTFPMYDSKKSPLFDFVSSTDLPKIMEKNLKKIRKNRGSMGKSDCSTMSEDLFEAFETSCLDSTSPKNRNLEKLRKIENQWIEERDKSKAKHVSLQNNTATVIKEMKEKIDNLKVLQESALIEIDELTASAENLKEEKHKLLEKCTYDRTYVGIMSLYTEGLFKVDNFRCTDETFCNAYHQDPGKCLRLRSLSSTVHHPS
ncbi:unnamed protein product [Orchesella dallaii]|uniref:Uncharacterized protein n=1 Tax=Orchesella dallaii TaxID=48710 RepID=A0ABP1QTE4_9HEXA